MSLIGSRLRALRAAKKMTLQEVATKVGVSKPHIWELEKGDNPNPSAKTLNGLASLFGVSVDHLLGRDVESGSSSELQAVFRSVEDAKLSEDEMARVKVAIEVALNMLRADRDFK